MDKVQTINALVQHYRKNWELYRAQYYDKYQYGKVRLENISHLGVVLEKRLNILIETVLDPVFKKQLKTLRPDAKFIFDFDVDNVEQLFEQLKDNIDCLNNSKIPNWLSNTIYFFNKNWRKQVCEKIAELYCKIIDFSQKTAISSERVADKELHNFYLSIQQTIADEWDMLMRAIVYSIKEQNNKLSI